MRVSIIGAGVIGCASAFELARRGCEVRVLERHGAVGHGSTSASCGIVRRFYSQPGMVLMAQEGAHVWSDWESHVGPIDDDLAEFRRPGMLFIPPRIDDATREILANMKRAGVPARLLSIDEIAERFPFLETASHDPPRPRDDTLFFEATGRRVEGAILEEDAGYVVSPLLATQNLYSAARREGARFLMRRGVEAIHRLPGGGFRLEASGGEPFESDVVLNASGPHSSRINRLAGVDLELETRPLRREVHCLANPLFDERTGSPVPVIGDLEGGVYRRPVAGGGEGVGGAADPPCDELEWVDDPDDYRQDISDLYWERQCLRLMKRIPGLRLGPARGVVNLYDVTVRDWYPIIDRTELPGYYVAIGTSGSSFKTSPVIGRLVAEIVEACEGGRDTDRRPLEFELPGVGTSVDTRFLSRRREKIATSGTVIG